MNWLGWCWVLAIGVFLLGVVLTFTSPLIGGEDREETGCAIGALGIILMIAMLFVTIWAEPGT